MRKKLASKTTKIVASALAAFVFIAAGAGALIYFQNLQPKLPPVQQHSDIPLRSVLTYQNSLSAKAPSDLSSPGVSHCAPLVKNWVQVENQNVGVPMTISDWANIDIANPEGSALWIDKTSADCGDKITVHASLYDLNTGGAPNEKGPRQIVVMRIGYYNGAGARVIWESAPKILKKRRIPYAKTATRMIETKWPRTTSFTIGSDWKPGFYFVTTISPSGKIEGMSPFILRSPPGSSPLVLVHSTITWAAYNLFGGRSMYFGPGSTAAIRMNERSRIASMDRPITGSGAVHIQRDAISFVQFIEKSGLNVDQIADTDLDRWPSLITHYNGVVFSGHAEYFTRRMFDTLVAARNTGINLAFFGANTAYWQTRIESSPSGPDRRVILYRDATEDPITDPKLVTVQFADKRINTPAALFTAGTTDGVHVYGDLHASHIPSWLKIPTTAAIRGWASDSEIEGKSKSHATPPNIHVLFAGMMHLRKYTEIRYTTKGRIPFAQTMWFTTPSGSAVFNAAITLWPCDLLSSCSVTQMDSKSRSVLQSVTVQVMKLWGQKQVGHKLK
jgi:hypothetical protein